MVTCICIKKNSFGAHQNQSCDFVVPISEGWAILPQDLKDPETGTWPNFPFGDVEVKTVHKGDPDEDVYEGFFGDRDNIEIVTKWTPLPIPDPEPEPEPEIPVDTITVQDLEDALIELETATNERLDAIEEALCELDLEAQA